MQFALSYKIHILELLITIGSLSYGFMATWPNTLKVRTKPTPKTPTKQKQTCRKPSLPVLVSHSLHILHTNSTCITFILPNADLIVKVASLKHPCTTNLI